MSGQKVKIQLRRDTEANWIDCNPVLCEGEPGFVTDTGCFVIGNGVDPFIDLCQFCCKEFKCEEIDYPQTSEGAPFVVDDMSTEIEVNVLSQSMDLDLNSVLPSNLRDGSRLVVRKLNSDRYKFVFDDGKHVYEFVNKRGEFISLFWCDNKWKI